MDEAVTRTENIMAGLLIIVSIVGLLTYSTQTTTISGQVENVVDGDTFRLSGEWYCQTLSRVRLFEGV